MLIIKSEAHTHASIRSTPKLICDFIFTFGFQYLYNTVQVHICYIDCWGIMCISVQNGNKINQYIFIYILKIVECVCSRLCTVDFYRNKCVNWNYFAYNQICTIKWMRNQFADSASSNYYVRNHELMYWSVRLTCFRRILTAITHTQYNVGGLKQ